MLSNPKNIRSRRDFNKYIIDYPTHYNSAFLKQHLIVETAVFFRSYPTRTMLADSFVFNYLNNTGNSNIISQYDPDIICGYEPESLSIGYIIKRGEIGIFK